MGVIKRATCTLLLLALCYASALAQGQPTPASISNAEFWRIISTFSETGGNFPSDNYTSNELMIGQVASDIIARGKTGGAYIGVGPEQNFTYIAAMKPEIVFIVDIRRQAVMQHLMYKAIFEMSGNRSEFIARLFSKPVQTLTPQDTAIRDIWTKYLPVVPDSAIYEKNIAAILNHLVRVRGFALSSDDAASIALVYNTFYRYGPRISYNSRAGASIGTNPGAMTATFLSLTMITDTSGAPRSFLATDANYQFVRGLHSKNLFIPVVGDVGGPKALRMVGDYLRERRTNVAGYYPSNVEQYLFRPPVFGANGGWQEYYTSVGLMPLDSSSIWIRSNSMRVSNALVVQQMPGMPQPASGTMGQVYELRSMVVGPPPIPPTPPVPPARPAEVQVAAMPTQLPNLGSLTGTIRDSATGNPLQSATVVIAGTASGATTNANGQYTIPNVAPGIYSLNIRRVGYAQASAADVRVAAGAPTVVDIRVLAQAINLTNVVSMPVGSASPNDIIVIRNPNTGVLSGPMVVSMSGSRGVVFCPMLEFLAAFKAGRVTSYEDATNCVR